MNLFRSDRELLSRFVAEACQESFAELVRRYTGLVHGACRRVLGEEALAEDATQAVFLVFARRARELRDAQALPAWLYRTAQQTARGALKMKLRRARHEQAAAGLRDEAAAGEPAAPAAADPWTEVRPHLDAALAELTGSQREAIVLRYFCGLPEAEIAERFGCTRSGVAARLSRGLEQLRGRLARYGAAVSVTLLATLLAERVAEAAPAELAAKLAGAALGTAAPSATAAALAETTVRTLLWSKLKLAATAATVLAVATTAGVVAGPRLVRALQRPAPAAASVAPGAPAGFVLPADLAELQAQARAEHQRAAAALAEARAARERLYAADPTTYLIPRIDGRLRLGEGSLADYSRMAREGVAGAEALAEQAERAGRHAEAVSYYRAGIALCETAREEAAQALEKAAKGLQRVAEGRRPLPASGAPTAVPAVETETPEASPPATPGAQLAALKARAQEKIAFARGRLAEARRTVDGLRPLVQDENKGYWLEILSHLRQAESDCLRFENIFASAERWEGEGHPDWAGPGYQAALDAAHQAGLNARYAIERSAEALPKLNR